MVNLHLKSVRSDHSSIVSKQNTEYAPLSPAHYDTFSIIIRSHSCKVIYYWIVCRVGGPSTLETQRNTIRRAISMLKLWLLCLVGCAAGLHIPHIHPQSCSRSCIDWLTLTICAGSACLFPNIDEYSSDHIHKTTTTIDDQQRRRHTEWEIRTSRFKCWKHRQSNSRVLAAAFPRLNVHSTRDTSDAD